MCALTLSGCASRQYVVDAQDYHAAQDHGGLVGAVTDNCRETALYAHRSHFIHTIDDPVMDEREDRRFVVVKEKSSRATAMSVGIGGILLGTLLGSMGGILIHNAANMPHPNRSDTLPETTGKALGSALIISGTAFLVGGGLSLAQGALRGAEAPRRWTPEMTFQHPCVVQQHLDALERAKQRSKQHSPAPNALPER